MTSYTSCPRCGSLYSYHEGSRRETCSTCRTTFDPETKEVLSLDPKVAHEFKNRK